MHRTRSGRRLPDTLPLLLAAALVFAAPASADEQTPLLQSKVYLQIAPESTAELEHLFTTLEDAVAADEPQADPVVVVLHGPEARRFLKSNYVDNQTLVDRAAKLEAFDRVTLRMCETWMRNNRVNRSDLLPFVDTIPLAPAEVERLEKEGYLPYGTRPPTSPLL